MMVMYRAIRGNSLVEPINVDARTEKGIKVGDYWYKIKTSQIVFCETRTEAIHEAIRMIDEEIEKAKVQIDSTMRRLENLRQEHGIATAELNFPV